MKVGVFRLVLLLVAFYAHVGVMAEDNDQMSCERMEKVSMHCDSLRNVGNFAEIERILGSELVKASGLADSCAHMSYLFSTLALAYEELGDTIMPEHFHHKAQELAANYEGVLAGPDSANIYRQRMRTLQEFITQSRMSFCKENLAYLEFLNQMGSTMFYYGNTLETIYLGEKVLKIAADSLVSHEMVVGTIYVPLLCSYSWENKMERVSQLLPDALIFYKSFPQLGENESTLNLYIGQYALDRKDYLTALPYLQKSADTELNKKSERYNYIQEMIRQCKANL